MNAPSSRHPARLLGFAALLAGALNAAPVEPRDINVEKELIIRDLKVVEGKEARNAPAGGRFTIEHLLQGVSRDGTAKTALLDWLGVWKNAAGVEIGRRLLEDWKKRDGVAGASDAAWSPQFAHAPFRLLAVTNRLDLQRRDADRLPLNAGEGRFVFGVTQGPGDSGSPLLATVIFEYELLARTEAEVLEWAHAWHSLGQFPEFNDDYGAVLAGITERFTKRDAAPHKPNGSALNQIRTNEIQLSGPQLGDFGPVWSLQEFRLHPAGGRFFAATTKQTPPDALFTSALTADYINAHEADILGQAHRVPRQFKGEAFLANQTNVPDSSTVLWNPPGVKNPAARYLFAFNTCNGCHGAEAQTGNFTHILVRRPGEVSGLSPFLRDVAPRDAITQTDHPELREITARQKVMALVLSGTPPAFSLLTTNQKIIQTPAAPTALIDLLAARANREH